MVFFAVWLTVLVGNMSGLDGNFTIKWLCVSSSPIEAVRHAWTGLTYMVTHYDILHLLFNMLWLMWFGRILTMVMEERHLTWIFVTGGIAGAIFYVGCQAVFPELSNGSPYLCGASAAVLAVMAGSAVRTPDTPLYLFLVGKVKLKWVALVCILLTFAGIGGGNGGGQAAHVGGVFAGIIYVLVYKLTRLEPVASGVQTEDYDDMDIPRRPRRKVTLQVGTPSVVRRNVVRDGHAVAKAASGRLSDSARLDALLDKIRLSGYSSLSEIERKELNALSERLN